MVSLTWIAASLIALPVGLFIYLLFSGAGDFIARWRARRRDNDFSVFVGKITRMDEELIKNTRLNLINLPKIFYPLIVIILGAIVRITAQGGAVISLALLVALVTVTIYLGQRSQLEQQAILTNQVEELITEYYSRWLLNASPFGILEDILENVALEAPIRDIVAHVLTRYRLGERDPLAPFRGSDSYLQQFGYILAQTARANNQSTAVALSEILKNLRLRKKLQKRVGTVTALVRGEEAFLIIANLTALAAVMLVPTLREYYLMSLSRQFVLAVSLLMITGGGIYFDHEIEGLKEKAL